jgi:hypothetical protein
MRSSFLLSLLLLVSSFCLNQKNIIPDITISNKYFDSIFAPKDSTSLSPKKGKDEFRQYRNYKQTTWITFNPSTSLSKREFIVKDYSYFRRFGKLHDEPDGKPVIMVVKEFDEHENLCAIYTHAGYWGGDVSTCTKQIIKGKKQYSEVNCPCSELSEITKDN